MASGTTLWVLLHDTPVGMLSPTSSDGCEFRLLESYKRAHPRPVLGQIFLDDLERVQRSRARVPSWFSNLLPEGPLRELIARKAGVLATREWFLLDLLGEDLPGAVRIVADGRSMDGEWHEVRPPPPPKAPDEWHFSLAGVQLKFSARKGERGLTIPVLGQGGDWIAKLPDARYPRVPENEYATMRWAQASGIPIPELELVEVGSISGLPASIGTPPEQQALAIRRFDRPAPGRRIHQEDFAQVLGLYPEEKYDKYNYETLARLIFVLAGEEGLAQFVRRLLFVVISGNGDAHHKNWSLVYGDGIQASLSPAYDLVSTIQYMPNDGLALNIARSKRWEDVGVDSFRRMARKIGDDEERMARRVAAAVEAITGAWREGSHDFGYDAHARARLRAHFARVPLLRGHGASASRW